MSRMTSEMRSNNVSVPLRFDNSRGSAYQSYAGSSLASLRVFVANLDMKQVYLSSFDIFLSSVLLHSLPLCLFDDTSSSTLFRHGAVMLTHAQQATKHEVCASETN
ncbi:uncharacterized protein AKAW2_80653S [Aspergillus luchuensis]|uniref:Uncharacterized protein n=1 Tax=Aspergillus kawachii TaxID=1069201 RepID=A0A7R7WKV0_ASPKA|nr:uncharacterized protein AKAW2_80653S [Aspergillus luchuensis]BCS04852.1 hypothetical protein AKAW2_80653S [Aspergillus luchuensis]